MQCIAFEIIFNKRKLLKSAFYQYWLTCLTHTSFLLTIVFFIHAAHGVALQFILYIPFVFKVVISCERVVGLSIIYQMVNYWIHYFPSLSNRSVTHRHRPQSCHFIKKETLAQVFSCEFCKILGTPFFTEHLWWLLLHRGRKNLKNCSEYLFSFLQTSLSLLV